MKKVFLILTLAILYSCETATTGNESHESRLPITGTWKLLSGATIENEDTTVTDYTSGQEFIKIINDTHFAFFRHDLNHGKDSAAIFVSGGGRYSLANNRYTEHLDYCNDRQWEGHKFEFEMSVQGDTLVQQGVERIENLGIDRVIIETYIKTKE